MKLTLAALFASVLLSACTAFPISDENEVPYQRVVTYKVHPDFKKRAYTIQHAIQSDKVLPDYLYRFFPPGELFVEYPYGDGFPVSYGCYISPLYTIESPSVSFESFFPYSEAFSQDYYLIALTDIAPNGQQTAKAAWINTRVDESNVQIKQGSNKKAPTTPNDYFTVNFDLEDGKMLVPYEPATPAAGTGEHRYVFILFRQALGTIPYHRLKQRLNWGTNITGHGIEDWANYYSLQPIGVNYFNSSNEGLF